MSRLIEQYEYNTKAGSHFEGADALPDEAPASYPARYIAYYLPQFHAIPENDEAWGPGFTEWTNVTKALPRYAGHHQPRLPADLGFYDLSLRGTLERQVGLAKQAGVFGFCLHYYWFSGRTVLETPLRLILENSDLDIPFFLNWANENWSRRWDGSESDIILEQRYEADDPVRFAEALIDVVRDPRYIRIGGRPVIMLYRPSVVPNLARVLQLWRETFADASIEPPYLIMPQAFDQEDPAVFGMDAAAGFPPHKFKEHIPNLRRMISLLDPDYLGNVKSYDQLVELALANRPDGFRYFPAVCPSWDNEARRARRSLSFFGADPHKYGQWLRAATRQAIEGAANPEEQMVFINAWNEWAEGAYLEPDRHFGYAYAAETRRSLDSFAAAQRPPSGISPPHAKPHLATRVSRLHYPVNRGRELVRKHLG